jgi:hypothetical protein
MRVELTTELTMRSFEYLQLDVDEMSGEAKIRSQRGGTPARGGAWLK